MTVLSETIKYKRRNMHQACVKYLRNAGIDFNRRGHPFSDFYLDLKIINDQFFLQSFENLAMELILALEEIKKINEMHHNEYMKRLSARDTSFWGVKYEIHWYHLLLKKLIENKIDSLRRGASGTEADFVTTYNGSEVSIETTSLTYDANSSMSDPIEKIKQAIYKKSQKVYSTGTCCLVIDISNLIFFRKIHGNFSKSISELTDSMNSKFGAVLLFQSVHIKDSEGYPRYVNQFYHWMNPKIDPILDLFIKDVFSGPREDFTEKLRFPIG